MTDHAYVIVEMRFNQAVLKEHGVNVIAVFLEDTDAYQFLDVIETKFRNANWNVSEESITTFACEKNLRGRRYEIKRVRLYPFTEEVTIKNPEIEA